MNPWKGLKGLPREMWIIAISTLINRMGTMVLPFLVIYLTTKIGLKTGTAGFVFTAYGLGGLVIAPIAGKLSDKIGSFRLIKASLFFSGILLLIFPVFTDFVSILVITLIWSIATESVRPASLSLMSQVVEPEKRKIAFALNRIMINLGMSIGPVVAGFLIEYHAKTLFYVDGITSILSSVFLMFFPIVLKKNSDDNNKIIEPRSEKIVVLKDLKFIYFLISLLPVSMVIFQFFGALPVFLVNDLKFAASTVGLVFAVNTVLIIFAEVKLNAAMSTWEERKSLTLGALLLGIGFGAMVFASNVFSIVVTVIIWTFGEMIIFPSSAAYVAEVAPESARGEYMGYLQVIFSLAIMLGPWLGTKVYESFGPNILWMGTFFVCGISAIMMFRLKGQVQNHHSERISLKE